MSSTGDLSTELRSSCAFIYHPTINFSIKVLVALVGIIFWVIFRVCCIINKFIAMSMLEGIVKRRQLKLQQLTQHHQAVKTLENVVQKKPNPPPYSVAIKEKKTETVQTSQSITQVSSVNKAETNENMDQCGYDCCCCVKYRPRLPNYQTAIKMLRKRYGRFFFVLRNDYLYPIIEEDENVDDSKRKAKARVFTTSFQ